MKKYIFVLVALLALVGCVQAADAPQGQQPTPTRVAVVPSPTLAPLPTNAPEQTKAPEPTKEPTAQSQSTAAPQTPQPPIPTATLQPVPTGTPTPTRAATVVPSTKFGTGFCTANGVTYPVMADASAVWNSEESLKALTAFGGHCEVTTVKNGFLWSIAFGTITRNGQPFERGMGMNAPEGKYVFDYDRPESGTPNDSIGLKFRVDYPKLQDGKPPFGDGFCVVDNVSYALSFDSTAVWQNDVLLKALWSKGGTCTFKINRAGWYWSVRGEITFRGNKMANGSRLDALPGDWKIVYTDASQNNGFVFRDNVPYQ